MAVLIQETMYPTSLVKTGEELNDLVRLESSALLIAVQDGTYEMPLLAKIVPHSTRARVVLKRNSTGNLNMYSAITPVFSQPCNV